MTPGWLPRAGPGQAYLPRPQGHGARITRGACPPPGFVRLVFCLQNRLLGGGGQRSHASLRLEQPCLPRASGSFLSPASGFFKPLPEENQVLWVSRTLRAPEPGQGQPDTAWGSLPAGAQRGCGLPPWTPGPNTGRAFHSSAQGGAALSGSRGPPDLELRQ